MNDAMFNLLCPFQLRWLQDEAPFSLWEKSRRIGATWTHALGVVLRRIEGAGNYYHSSADQSASVEFIDYCDQWAKMANAVAKITEEKEVIEDEEVHTLVMRFANGTKIVAGSSNPKFFRSKGGEVGLDELAFHRDGRELYKAAHATAMFWGYRMRGWSSHNGPGSYFNGLIKSVREGRMKGNIHRTTILDAVEDGIVERIIMRKKGLDYVPAPDAKARQEWLDELRATCPDDDTWDEEYMCIPGSDESALLSYELIDSVTEENLKPVPSVLDLQRENAIYFAGYDVGRKHDFSVLWVSELVGDVLWTRGIWVLDRSSFPAQEGVINALLSNPCVRRACIDQEGIGAQLAENAMRRFGSRVEGVTLSGPVKATLGMTFRDKFIDHLVRIPSYVTVEAFDKNDAINRIINRRNMKETKIPEGWLREDLHKTKKGVTAAGNIRLAADSDDFGHADGFWAGALMNEAASDLKAQPIHYNRKLARRLGRLLTGGRS